MTGHEYGLPDYRISKPFRDHFCCQNCGKPRPYPDVSVCSRRCAKEMWESYNRDMNGIESE